MNTHEEISRFIDDRGVASNESGQLEHMPAQVRVEISVERAQIERGGRHLRRRRHFSRVDGRVRPTGVDHRQFRQAQTR